MVCQHGVSSLEASLIPKFWKKKGKTDDSIEPDLKSYLKMNPSGIYPGHQIRVGNNTESLPAITYLVTGTSNQSKARQAVHDESGTGVRITSLYEQKREDVLRNYNAVFINPKTKTLVVSNSQAPVYAVDAIWNQYGYEGAGGRTTDLLASIGAEEDELEGTIPRIIGVFDPRELHYAYGMMPGGISFVSKKSKINRVPGLFYVIQTFQGSSAAYCLPETIESDKDECTVNMKGQTAAELTQELFAEPRRIDEVVGDLFVTAVAAVWDPPAKEWNVHIRNNYASLREFEAKSSAMRTNGLQ